MVAHEARANRSTSFRVLTLNTAHGRRLKGLRPYCHRETVERHLHDIARVLRRERPDVAALQEVDRRSCLSGNFDHAERLAHGAEFAHYFLGEHVSVGRRRRIAYGTALLSKLPLKNPKSVTFHRPFSVLTKGFVVASISLPGAPHLEVDFVSVHLACLRRQARQRQVRAMVEHLGGRKAPLIVLGDLNCQWDGEDDSLRWLARQLNLQVHAPDSTRLATHHLGGMGRRIDWILASPPLRLKHYAVLPDRLSDHLAVLAEIEFADFRHSSLDKTPERR